MLKLLVITLFFVAILLLIIGYYQLNQVCPELKTSEIEHRIEILKKMEPEKEILNYYTQIPHKTYNNYFEEITPWIKNIPPIRSNVVLQQPIIPLQF